MEKPEKEVADESTTRSPVRWYIYESATFLHRYHGIVRIIALGRRRGSGRTIQLEPAS